MLIEFNEEKHEYFIDGKQYPSVTQILEVVNNYKWVNKTVLDKAAKFGTAAHKMTELHDRNNLNMDSVAAVLIPYLEGWKKFLNDTQFKIWDIEYSVASKLGYAGTFDRLGMMQGKLTLLDIKTTTVVPKTTALQLAAYGHAYEEMTKQKIQQRISVQLKPYTYFIRPYNNTTDFLTFMNFLTVYKWSVNNGL